MDARWLVLILIVPGVLAQAPQSGPDVVMLVHHPYPDDADILGVPFGEDCSRACDAFVVRHGSNPTFRDGIDFPGFIADGRIAAEALPPGGFDATLALYDDAVKQRLATETPVILTIGTRVVDDVARTSIWAEATQDVGAGLVLWIAVVEDPVHYEPPPGLSNGVTEHPFTVRSVQRIGAIDLTGTEPVGLSIPLDEAWDQDNTRIAAWIEQDRTALGTFEPGEVVQAVSHRVQSSGLTRQTDRAVLIEAYSASWCDPCLIGDAALEALAEAHGLPTGRTPPAEPSYLQDAAIPSWALGALALLGAIAVAWAPLGGRR